MSEGCFLTLQNKRFSRFSSPIMGTLIKRARMPPARMGSTRSTSCAAKVRTAESRSSATKSVTPTTVMSRYCFVFGSMKKNPFPELMAAICKENVCELFFRIVIRSSWFVKKPGTAGFPFWTDCDIICESQLCENNRNIRRCAGKWRNITESIFYEY